MIVSRAGTENLTKASWIRRMFEEGARLKQERGADKVFDFTLGIRGSSRRCAYGSWGGQRPSMACYVTVMGTKEGATAAGCRSRCLSSIDTVDGGAMA